MIWAALAESLLSQNLRVCSKTAEHIVRVLGKEASLFLTSEALLFPNLSAFV